MKTTTSKRLTYIMEAKKLRQVDILERAKPFCKEFGVKLNRNDLSQYVNGKVEPGQKKLSILSLTLNVSEAWLMGYDVPMERQNNDLVNAFMTGARMKTMQPIVEALSESDFDMLVAFGKTLLNQRAERTALEEIEDVRAKYGNAPNSKLQAK